MTSRVASVIVPYFNERQLLGRALRSIAEQRVESEIEVIVVDDCSDLRPDVAERVDVPVSFVRTPRRLYAGGARNFGARWAHGSILLFLDADDMYCPGRIARHVAFLESHPEVVFVGSRYLRVEHGIERPIVPEHLARLWPGLFERDCVLPREFRFRACEDYCFTTGSISFDTTVFEKLGGFDESLRWGEEWELQARAAQLGRVGFVATPSFRYLCRSGSITTTPDPLKYVSMAGINRSLRKSIAKLPVRTRFLSRRAEQRAWLLACQLYLDGEGREREAFRCAAKAVKCGASVWAIRSLLRASLRYARVKESATR